MVREGLLLPWEPGLLASAAKDGEAPASMQ
jgi:hypothetical protein